MSRRILALIVSAGAAVIGFGAAAECQASNYGSPGYGSYGAGYGSWGYGSRLYQRKGYGLPAYRYMFPAFNGHVSPGAYGGAGLGYYRPSPSYGGYPAYGSAFRSPSQPGGVPRGPAPSRAPARGDSPGYEGDGSPGGTPQSGTGSPDGIGGSLHVVRLAPH